MGLVTVNAKRGNEMLKNITKSGAEFRLKNFVKASQHERDMIVCEAFSRQIVRFCKNSLNRFDFSNSEATVDVSKSVSVSFSAYDRRGQYLHRRVHTMVKLLSIMPILISDEYIEYSLEVAPIEYDEIIGRANERVAKHLDLTNFSEYHFELEDSEKKALEEYSKVDFWESVLPETITYRNETLLSDFMDTLNIHRMSDVIGNEVSIMKEIYFAAAKVFPEFRKLPQEEQVKLMDLAYTLGKRVERGKRDIHSFSKATFIAMVYMNVCKTFLLDGKKYTVQSTGSKMLDCEFTVGKTVLRSSLLPFDVWHGLAKSTGLLVA